MPLGIAEGFPCKMEWAEAEVVAIDLLFMPAQPTWAHAHYVQKWRCLALPDPLDSMQYIPGFY